ncbi:MAG: glycosyltransferase family 2 protein, partial [Oscillochloris sp.]|nr:glycosyltransferase family 2 protein [Oscillochloris sp.]
IELAYRLEKLGVEFAFTIDAIGYHYAERSFKSWLQIPYTYGRYEVVFSNEHHEHIMDFIEEEFGYRNLLTRLTVAICLDRPRLSSVILAIAKLGGDRSYPIGAPGMRISRVAYSAIFNLRYYQGVADELGGRNTFYRGMKSRTVGKPTAS